MPTSDILPILFTTSRFGHRQIIYQSTPGMIEELKYLTQTRGIWYILYAGIREHTISRQQRTATARRRRWANENNTWQDFQTTEPEAEGRRPALLLNLKVGVSQVADAPPVHPPLPLAQALRPPPTFCDNDNTVAMEHHCSAVSRHFDVVLRPSALLDEYLRSQLTEKRWPQRAS